MTEARQQEPNCEELQLERQARLEERQRSKVINHFLCAQLGKPRRKEA